MDTRKLRERFEVVKTLRTNSIHPTIDKVRKKRPRGKQHPKYDSLWYMKREPKCDQPVHEVIGQELFRLLLPNQPKTRLMLKRDIYGKRDQLYILSKEITGYRPFGRIKPSELLTNILNEQYTGLGEVLVAALFLREGDMHLGNIGIDENGHVVKIDGGFIFNSNKKTMAADIAALPMLSRSYPTNWIGINQWNEKLDKSELDPEAVLASEQIRNLPAFRREVNQMLLKICLLPDELIRKMIFSYGAEASDAEKMTAFLLKSKQEIQAAALANADFIAYAVSAEAEAEVRAYFTYLEEFKTTGKYFLLRDDEMDLGFLESMTVQFIKMREEAEKQYGARIVTQVGRLFGLIPTPEADEPVAQRLRKHP